MVELVKNTITGHMRTPIRKANDGQRYARQGRRRQTSSPTTASASSSRPMIRKPVANHQWTNSARGSILRLLQVLEQAGRHQERKRETDENDVERRLGEQPPEALAMGVQHRQAVGLQEPPDDAGQHGQWTDQVDDDGARRPARPRCRDLGCVLSFHSSSRKSASRRSPRAVRAGYASAGGGRLSNARPKRRRGVARGGEAPWEPWEQERDSALYGSGQERVVVGAGIARRRDVPADVEPMGQAAADELDDEREQGESDSRQKALVSARPFHAEMVLSRLADRRQRPAAKRPVRAADQWRGSGNREVPRADYPTVVRVHPPGDDASKPSSKTRCQVPRQSCASRNGICSVRGPSKKRTWRSRSGISSGTRRSSKSSRSSKKPVSRSLMRTTPLSSAGET